MRRAAKVDGNHFAVLDALRNIGCSVFSTHQVGAGFPDIVCARSGKNFLIEVKDPKQPASKRKLTKDQVVFHRDWRGPVAVVEGPKEAVEYVMEMS